MNRRNGDVAKDGKNASHLGDDRKVGVPQAPARRNHNRAPATQTAAIAALAEAKGICKEAMDEMLSVDFGVEWPEDLTANEASRLYETLLCMEGTRR